MEPGIEQSTRPAGSPAATEWQPRIVAFLCNWCSYTGADLAGISRISWSPSVRIVRVMCSGRLDPTFVVKAFRLGADGVIVSGCHPGDCHYQKGNYKALRRVHLLKRLLADFGIEPQRLRLAWVSASEGVEWAKIANDMARTVRILGPLRLGASPSRRTAPRVDGMGRKAPPEGPEGRTPQAGLSGALFPVAPEAGLADTAIVTTEGAAS